MARRRLTRSPWLPPQQRGTQAEHREGHDRKKTKHHHRRHHRQHAIISIIKMMVLRDGAIKFRKLYDKVTTIFKAVFTTKTSGDALTDEMYNFSKLLRRKHSRDLTDEERGYIADLTSVKNRIKQLEVQTSKQCTRRPRDASMQSRSTMRSHPPRLPRIVFISSTRTAISAAWLFLSLGLSMRLWMKSLRRDLMGTRCSARLSLVGTGRQTEEVAI